ncbi:MAG: LysR family transcriptional regulator [Methylococcaceae bacterium]|nr:LysR family transcriptional regulator [Methylococcaceae bacterium]
MDKLKSMNAFCLVSELGSFAAAAERLNLSGPMVSKLIARLEQGLGVSLLNRTTRKVNLTDAGRQYYPRCKQVLHDLTELEELTNQIDHLPKGLLRINAPIDFGMMHMVSAVDQYRKVFSDVDIHLVLDNRYVDLNDGTYDIVIRITDEPDFDVIGKIIRTTELCTYASPSYLEQFGEPLSIDALKDHRCLQFLGTPHGDSWIFQNGKSIRSYTPRWCFASNNGNVLCQAAKKGMGIFQAPDITVAPYLHSGTLKEILHTYRVPSLPIYAMYLSRRYVPIKIKSFIEFLTDYFAKMHCFSGRVAF